MLGFFLAEYRKLGIMYILDGELLAQHLIAWKVGYGALFLLSKFSPVRNLRRLLISLEIMCHALLRIKIGRYLNVFLVACVVVFNQGIDLVH
jgi:hypothetical protein